MKAITLDKPGGPENLKLAELPDPKPGPGEVVVRVRACGINHLDLWVREGLPAYKITLPHILGSDVAGEILELGPGVSGFKTGDRVAVSPGKSCGACEFCSSGRESICPEFRIIGADGGPGGYAERLLVAARCLLPIVPSLGFEQAAAFPLTFLTAWHMLVTRSKLRAGETVLVMGAGSGVAVAGVQIAKLCGARVIAASTSQTKLEKAGTIGADAGLLVGKGDLSREMRRLTQGRMADVVFEHVGPAVFESAIKSLRPGGRLVTCGATSGPEAKLDLRYVFSRELQIMGARMGGQAEMRAVARLVNEGRLKPVVDRTFPLSQAADAHHYLAQKAHFGKVVLTV